MKIKKYEAKDINEAVKMIKRDFGNEAVILHSRTINKGGFMGMFGAEMVEVMAGVDINLAEAPQRKQYSGNFATTQSNLGSSKKVYTETAYSPRVIRKTVPSNNNFNSPNPMLENKLNNLTKEMDDIKDTLNIIVKKVANSPHPMISPKLMSYYTELDSIGLGEDLIIKILQEIEANFKGNELEDPQRINSYIKHKVTQMLGNVSTIDLDLPDSKSIIALVGPTGVGKTTTIAKMAANFNLIQKKEVALITIDTFRVAAIEQLRNYANIIGIPLEVVFDLDDFARALRKLKSADLILIDTAGRSPKNENQVLELKRFLKNSFIDTYLVLSATAKAKDMFNTLKLYSSIAGDKVIFTKVDETDSLGSIVDVITKFDKKLTYFTNGQNVPDDFEVAYANRITDLMFAGINIGG